MKFLKDTTLATTYENEILWNLLFILSLYDVGVCKEEEKEEVKGGKEKVYLSITMCVSGVCRLVIVEGE